MTDQNRRTLADMTLEEREKCRGMWCESKRGELRIIHHYGSTLMGYCAYCITPADEAPETLPTSLYLLTPRLDLPRAWNPDGAPVAADPEEYTADGRSRVYFEGIEKVAFPPGTKVRRWVSDWEEA